MSILSTLVEFGTSGGFGVITGIIGAAVTKYQEIKLLEVKNDHELKMGELSLREIAAETDRDLQLADKKIDLAEAEGFQESLKPTGKWGDAAKAIVRPLITLYLLGVTTWLSYSVWQITEGLEKLPEEQILAIMNQIIGQIIFLTCVSTGWWFAARPPHSKVVK